MKFEVENLSSGQADCFFIHMENDRKDTCTILVDGNRQGQIKAMSTIVAKIARLEKLDYIVVTHVDNDHLGGILSLFQIYNTTSVIRNQLKDTIIIYNFVSYGEISYKQAEIFDGLLHDRKVIKSFSNQYENRASMLKLLPLPVGKILYSSRRNENNAYLIFLGPDRAGANEVACDYQRCKLTGASSDEVIVNKNSITFLLEFAGKRVLFLGDAYLADVDETLDLIERPGKPLEISLIKVPHHGAKDNNTQIGEFAQKHQCGKFIITAGAAWDKKHPAAEIVEQLYRIKADIYTEVDLSMIDSNYKYIHKTDRRISIL